MKLNIKKNSVKRGHRTKKEMIITDEADFEISTYINKYNYRIFAEKKTLGLMEK